MRSVRSLAPVLVLLLVSTAGCPLASMDMELKTLNINGQIRTYWVYAPASCDGSAPVPLVLALHPFATTGLYMARTTNFNAVADEEGFIVAYPNGCTRLWNGDPTDDQQGRDQCRDDVQFVDALLDELPSSYRIDPARIYVCGASNGGLMTQRLACELAERFAAAASVMTTLPVGWGEVCEPTAPISVLLMQGVDDPFFPWEGGTVQQGPFMQSDYGSAADMVTFWVSSNSSVSPPTTEDMPDTVPEDGTTVFRETYTAGPAGAEVVFYGIVGGGHTWPGSTPRLSPLVGTTSQDIDATRTIWEFFARHAGPSRQASGEDR